MQKTQTKPAAPSLPPLITPKIPPMVGKIQVNFCKSPQCANFGVPAKNGPLFEGKYLPKEDTYDLYTTGYKRDGGSIQTLKCKLCGEFPTVKSNLGIYEELSRFMAPFQPRIVSCPGLTGMTL